MIDRIKKLSKDIFSEVVSIRRHIHQHPELSFHEFKTSAYIKSILNKWKIPFTDNIAKTGVVVLIRGKNPTVRTIALRADFDALPILEENNIDYCSVNKGVMHACGHDAHVAILMGAAEFLAKNKKNLKSLKLLAKKPYEHHDHMHA